MSSLSFNWKRIEETPDNADDVRLLIDDVIIKEVKKKEVKQPLHLLEYFINYFKLENFFNIEKVEKKIKKSKKDLIIEQNDYKNIESDFTQFLFEEDYSLKRVHFINEINNYLYILYWCLQILRGIKEKKKISPLTILDATLSINRILEKGTITDPSYQSGFDFFNKKMNSIMNNSFYNLLFENPKMLYHCSAQRYTKEIHLYKEQRIILDQIYNAVDKDSPLLLGNQLPTGQGKTFLSVPLAKMFSIEKQKKKSKINKCVLFACSNELVNMDVASNALIGNDIHLWMAKNLMIDIYDKRGDFIKRDFRVLLRPYKSCFPNTWKKVYKKKEDDKFKNGTIHEQWTYYTKATGRIPDIIVADLESCYQLLEYQSKLLKYSNEEYKKNKNAYFAVEDNINPFVAYIDEFIGDDPSNKKMVDICKFLPRQTVLLSSVLPKFEYIPSIVQSFSERHKTTKDECSSRVSSTDISIPCCIIHPSGKVFFPHHYIKTKEELIELSRQMKMNPRIRRTYSPKHVYFLSKHIESILPENLKFSTSFPSIGSIEIKKIIDYVCLLFDFLIEHFEYLEIFQEYCPKVMNSIEKNEIFQKQCWEYDPKTLVVMNNPLKQVIDLTNNLFKDNIKIDKLILENDKKKENLKKKIETMKNKKVEKKGKNTFDKVYNMDQLEQLQDEYNNSYIHIPNDMILNHKEHFQRFNQIEKKLPSIIHQLISPNLPEEYFQHFTDNEIYQILSGIGTYDISQQTEYQRNLMMKLYHKFSFFCSGKEIVYGTNLSSLVNIFIDEEFMDTINIPELYQLMGRVGRMGRSYNANIITMNEDTVKKLLSFDESFESENDIERLFSLSF